MKEFLKETIGLIVLTLLFALVFGAFNKSHARTWKQGAMRYIHYHNNCHAGSKPVIASFYWQGQRLASGGRFNPNGHSVAHRSLPFGHKLRVTNPKNRKSVWVVVNDRGPYVKGVTLDLSRGAARHIGMTSSQYVCVEGL